MANRILGRGDVAALIQAFEGVVGEEKAERDALRMLEGHFDLNDFSEQIQLLEKMSPFTETAQKDPGRRRGSARRSGDRRRTARPHARDDLVDDRG
jgi:signal recognition particle GTPase